MLPDSILRHLDYRQTRLLMKDEQAAPLLVEKP